MWPRTGHSFGHSDWFGCGYLCPDQVMRCNPGISIGTPIEETSLSVWQVWTDISPIVPTATTWIKPACEWRLDLGPWILLYLNAGTSDFFQWHSQCILCFSLLLMLLGVSFPLLANKSPKWYTVSSYSCMFFFMTKCVVCLCDYILERRPVLKQLMT